MSLSISSTHFGAKQFQPIFFLAGPQSRSGRIASGRIAQYSVLTRKRRCRSGQSALKDTRSDDVVLANGCENLGGLLPEKSTVKGIE